MNNFSISSFIRAGWDIFKKHWKFIILAGIATLIIEIILNILTHGAGNGRMGTIGSIVVNLFALIIGIIVALGWAQVLLKLVRHNHGSWNDFETRPTAWLRLVKVILWYIGYFIVYSVAATILFAAIAIIGHFTHIFWLASIGSILAVVAFVIVAIYFGIRYMFSTYAVLDYPELSSHKIFKKAGQITKGHLLDLLGLAIILGLLNIGGLICIVIGLAITIPVTKLAKAKAYDTLKNHSAQTPAQF